MRPLRHAAAPEPACPPGFLYVPRLVTPAEEAPLLDWLEQSEAWNTVTFRGQTARRRALSFGARYLAQGKTLRPAPPLPPMLLPYRDRMLEAARAGLGEELALVGREPADFVLATALHYPPGAAIGWHTDNRVFGPTVLSLSLRAPARLQLRPSGTAEVAFEQQLASGSLFVLAGEVRRAWQHRILPVRAARYSLTVRAPAAP